MKKSFITIGLCILLLLAVSCETAQNDQKPLCDKKIECNDGRIFPAESFNEKIRKCEPLLFAGGTPCFDEFGNQTKLCEGDICLS